ncbi:hypothetical protein [uncultured Salinisphaera sp.]|uniref:hypothetical protein n=1 Tax=uncultured Salinisphaera sp. TaxID=359372 RepID=UPI0032B1A0C2
MSFSDRFAASAQRAINRVGKSVVYRRTQQGEYDPIEGGYTGGGTTEYPIKVAPPGTFDNEYIDGTLVQRSDLRVTVPAASLPFAPAIAASDTEDAIEIDGTIYGVIAVSPAYAGESIATYELQVRG